MFKYGYASTISIAILFLLATTGGLRAQSGAFPWKLKSTVTIPGTYKEAYAVKFSPTGKQVGAIGSDGTLHLWDFERNAVADVKVNTGWCWDLAFSPDGGQVATSGGFDQTIKIWDTQTLKLLHTLTGHTNKMRDLIYLPDGDLLASCNDDKTVRLWDTDTGKTKRTLTGSPSVVMSIACSSDGKQLLAGAGEGTLLVFHPDTGGLSRTIKAHDTAIRSIAYNARGDKFATGAFDGLVKFWDAKTFESIKTMKIGNARLTDIEISDAGNMLAVAISDGPVMIYDANTYFHLATADFGEVGRCLSFSPNSDRLAVSGDSGDIKIFDVKPLRDR